MWPGSILGTRLLKSQASSLPPSCKVLVLGCGTGVEALGAASLGFNVHALDLNPLSLSLTSRAASLTSPPSPITTEVFDLTSKSPLPLENVDVVLACDTLYNEELAKHVGRRCYEVLSSSPSPPALIVTDSQRFHGTDFLVELNAHLFLDDPAHEIITWSTTNLSNVTSSGILIPEDQNYDIDVRYIDI